MSEKIVSYIITRQRLSESGAGYGEVMYACGDRFVMSPIDATTFADLDTVLNICLAYNDNSNLGIKYHYFPKQLVTEVFDV